MDQKEYIWYLTYKGLPYSTKAKGAPVFFKSLNQAGNISRFANKKNNLSPEHFQLKRMRCKDFYAKEWPGLWMTYLEKYHFLMN